MRYSNIAAVALAMLFAVSANGQSADARKLKDQLTGDAKGSASGNPQCKLFTQTEIVAYVGAQVGPGENNQGGAGCIWHAKNHESFATVTVVRPDYFPEPTQAEGFKHLPDVGRKGWVTPDSGWSAGALVQEGGVVVVIHGKTASEASAVALLRESMKRLKK